MNHYPDEEGVHFYYNSETNNFVLGSIFGSGLDLLRDRHPMKMIGYEREFGSDFLDTCHNLEIEPENHRACLYLLASESSVD